jgi:hypothetical protein
MIRVLNAPKFNETISKALTQEILNNLIIASKLPPPSGRDGLQFH